MDTKNRIRAAKLEQLRQAIRAGLESGPSTAWNPAQIRRDGLAKLAIKKLGPKA